jgi:hypothetical protein
MVASEEPWQPIATFNEWGEGTAVERAHDGASDTGYGAYLDALHNDGEGADADDDVDDAPGKKIFVRPRLQPIVA